MTLPVYPSSISMSQVNTELGKSATASISLNDTNVRTLAQKPSSTISMYDLFGKSNTFSTITEIGNINVNTSSISQWGVGMNYNGTRVAIGISGAVVVYSRTGSTWSLTQTISNAASQYGFSVSMSHDGNTLFTTSLGSGYVYTWNGNSYVNVTTFTIPNNGYMAVMNSVGDTIFSDCKSYSAPGFTNSGRAIIFKKVNGTWDAGTFVYPPTNYNSFNWWPKTISGDGNWKFISGNGTTAGMGRLSVFDAANNRYDFPNTATSTAPSVVVCDYTATNVYHTFTDTAGNICRRYTRSGTTFTLVETIPIPPGYSAQLNYMTGLGMSKFGEYSVAGHQFYGPSQLGAFWTYNSFAQKSFFQNTQASAGFGGASMNNPGGVMSGDGGIIWQLRASPSGLRFFTYT